MPNMNWKLTKRRPNLTSNIENLIQPKAFASFGAAHEFINLKARQELSDINEKLSEGGGDASN